LTNRPNSVIILIFLWVLLAFFFLFYGGTSLSILINSHSWVYEAPESFQPTYQKVIPYVHLGFLISTIIFFVFSVVFFIFAYGTFRKNQWIWTASLIISSIFLVILSLMLASFMINVILFKDDFSIYGLVSSIIVFLTDLGVIFYLTRPSTKIYFEIE
jgi:hypothetical protein